MTRLPDYESSLIPEGNYIFTVDEEPEVRKKTNEETGRKSIRVIIKLQVSGTDLILVQSFFPWTDTYKELAIAFDAPADDKGKIHMSQIEQFTGLRFKADIIHEKGEGINRDKTYMRVVNVQAIAAASTADDSDNDDDLPF